MQRLNDRDQLARYFRKDLPLYVYNLGDLDDRYFTDNSYYGIMEENGISHVIQLYRGEGIPVLLVLGPEGTFDQDLIDQIDPLLPEKIYAHLSPGLERLFLQSYSLQDFGSHYKMALEEPGLMGDISTGGTIRLAENDLPLNPAAYPEDSISAGDQEGGWSASRESTSIHPATG
jgi:hypothetical protein